jgi:hypothetical protein
MLEIVSVGGAAAAADLRDLSDGRRGSDAEQQHRHGRVPTGHEDLTASDDRPGVGGERASMGWPSRMRDRAGASVGAWMSAARDMIPLLRGWSRDHLSRGDMTAV